MLRSREGLFSGLTSDLQENDRHRKTLAGNGDDGRLIERQLFSGASVKKGIAFASN
jgi:hypothetical protein